MSDTPTVEEIVEGPRPLARPNALEGMARFGIATESALGVLLPDLRAMGRSLVAHAATRDAGPSVARRRSTTDGRGGRRGLRIALGPFPQRCPECERCYRVNDGARCPHHG